jgi:hypothetical protein
MSNQTTSILFLLTIIFITLGLSIFFKWNRNKREGFVEGLTLSEDEIALLQLTSQYQIADLSLCVSAIYQIQPLVTTKTDTNQFFINQTIQNNFNAPATALYYIINPPTDSNANPAAPSGYTIPENVEAIIHQLQPSRVTLCGSFIKNIFSTVPNLTTKQGNQAPADQILATQLQSFQKNTTNGSPPLPGTPSTSSTSPPSDIVSYITGHYYASV